MLFFKQMSRVPALDYSQSQVVNGNNACPVRDGEEVQDIECDGQLGAVGQWKWFILIRRKKRLSRRIPRLSRRKKESLLSN